MIVIAFDGSPAARAAVNAAGRLLPGLESVVLTVYRPLATPEGVGAAARIAVPDDVIREGAARLDEETRARAQATADEGGALAREAGLSVRTATRARVGSAWSALLEAAGEEQAELVVCGTRGQRAAARVLLGSTSSALVHHAERPVLVVPEGEAHGSEPIALAYDGSEGAQRALAVTARLFGDRRTLVLHAWEAPLAGSVTGEWLHDVPLAEMRGIVADVEAFFAQAASDTGEEGAALAREHGLDARALPAEGRDAQWRTIADAAAAEGAAVVVAGSRGLGAARGALLGSVSMSLVHNTDRPVMIVPSADRESPASESGADAAS